jgi:Uma2 family endonuclease
VTDRAEERCEMRMGTETRRWTWEEFERLPEEPGVTYEFVDGELWVTPPPSEYHNEIVARLTAILLPYVVAQGLGLVFLPRAALRAGRDRQLEPDIMVRRPHPDPRGSWETAPRPILVVEVVSPSSRRRDYGEKRDVYVEHEIPEYWIVDGDERRVTVVRPGRDPVTVSDVLTWNPAGAREPLTFTLSELFR